MGERAVDASGLLLSESQLFRILPVGLISRVRMAAGSLIRILKPEDLGRAMLWMLGIGLALIMIARYFAELRTLSMQRATIG